MWDIDAGPIQAWLASLSRQDYAQVFAALQVLSEDGPALGRPLVDSIKGSRHKNMKELRPGSTGRSEIRILFAFDPKRRAILLVPGTRPATGSVGTPRTSPLQKLVSTSTSEH